MNVSIKYDNIKELKFINNIGGLTHSKVKELHKPDAMINLTLYDTVTMQNITRLRVDGQDSGYLFCDEGLVIDDNKLKFATHSSNFKNYVSGSPNLVKDSKVNIDWGNKYSSYIDGKHLRSAVGTNDKELILYNSKDLITVTELANRMKDLGCTHAINLDGGGSCHLENKSNVISTTTRSIVSWLLIYYKDNVQVEVPETKLYRVQVGAFGVKDNAERLASELRLDGYSAIITT